MSDPKVRHINPPGLSTPRGYSHVVEASGGRTIYVAGQVALDQHGKLIGEGDFAAQAEQVFTNLKTALAAAGADLSHVVKMTSFVRNVAENLATLRAVRDRHLPVPPPANTLIEINRLVQDNLLLEIEAVAVVP
ncbi:MAG TPA: RidA family protein [Candidatus Binataceae bacterium]|nr:RidA family protein [Candidatus Binataceae bacterium]